MTNRPRSSGLNPSLEFLLFLAGLVILLPTFGCQSIDKAGTRDSRIDSARREAEVLWSDTLYFGDMRFRFQLPANQQDAKPNFGTLNRMDFIEVDGIRVYRHSKRFKIGSANFRWNTDSIIWIHSPPTETVPFQRQQGSADLTFFGSGSAPVIEEQQPDGGFIWTYMNARISMSKDQRITYRFRGLETPYPGNTPMILGPQGELLEKRRR